MLGDRSAPIKPGAPSSFRKEQNAFLRDGVCHQAPRNFSLIPEEFARLKVRRSTEVGDEEANFFLASRGRERTPRHAAPRFSALSRPRPIFRRWNSTPTSGGGREKLKSHQRAIIVSPGVVRHPAKVKQFAGPYTDDDDDVTFSLFRARVLPHFFCTLANPVPSAVIAADSRGYTCRQRRPCPKTFDEVEQRFVVLHNVYFRQD